jgi:hypothetical protein
MKRVAIVAVETNLLGRIVEPPGAANDAGNGHLWPFRSSETTYSDDRAEIVGAFVGDLDEGGQIKFVLRGLTTGLVRISYHHGFVVKEVA